jgi:fructose/tagatose bisphosphate aldolase
MISGNMKKRLDIGRIREIAKTTGVPLTLHGGSGTNEIDFRRATLAGMAVVHINTEIRVAWRQGLEIALAENPDELIPYRILDRPVREIHSVVRDRLLLFQCAISRLARTRQCGTTKYPRHGVKPEHCSRNRRHLCPSQTPCQAIE